MPFVNVGNKKIYYLHSTPERTTNGQPGFTLLFIHGLGSSSSFYAPVIPNLVKAGFSCLALDTHGSGLSSFTGEQQDPASYANDVRDILSTLQVDLNRTVVVGHSMGCIIASELASSHKLAGVVLIGAIDPDPKYGQVFNKRIETVTQSGMESMADIIPTAATGSKSNSLHHAFIRALLLSQTADGYVSLCRAIVAAKRPDYSRIECRVLFIAGSQDKTATLSDAQAIMASLGTQTADVHLEILDGVGHWHCIEAPEEVADHLIQFVRGLKRVRTPESSVWRITDSS